MNPITNTQESIGNTGKWWLWTILFPALFSLLGVFIGLAAPKNQDDWLGLGAVIPAIICLIIGCLLSVVAAGISIMRRERNWPTGALVGLLAAIFLVWVGGLYTADSARNARKCEASASTNRMEVERNARRDTKVNAFFERIIAQPDLLMNPQFWAENGTDRELESGVIKYLQSGGQMSNEQAKETLRYGPFVAPHVFYRQKFSLETFYEIAVDKSFSREVREQAMQRYLQSNQFVVTPELKTLIESEFLLQIDTLFRRNAWTREEIDEHVSRPVENMYIRMAFQKEQKRLQSMDKR